MKGRFSLVVGFLAGAFAMYYLDPRAGRRRRALARDQFVAAGHDAAWHAQAKSRRALDRLKGWAATRRLDRHTRKAPESDQQLHERIRSRLGRLVSHPKPVEVHVQNGCVRLGGHILTRELDSLLSEVKRMPGVKVLRNELVCHDSPAGIAEFGGGATPPGCDPRSAEPAIH